jgi:uncharacterized membrane protein YbhN (UPF0104 family)
MLLSILSYGAMARSYQGIADVAGRHLPFREWLRITFVSNTANYLVTSAGLSGFAVRMLLLSQHGVSSGRAVLISLVQTFLTNFTLLFFILGGIVALVARQHIGGCPSCSRRRRWSSSRSSSCSSSSSRSGRRCVGARCFA